MAVRIESANRFKALRTAPGTQPMSFIFINRMKRGLRPSDSSQYQCSTVSHSFPGPLMPPFMYVRVAKDHHSAAAATSTSTWGSLNSEAPPYSREFRVAFWRPGTGAWLWAWSFPRLRDCRPTAPPLRPWPLPTPAPLHSLLKSTSFLASPGLSPPRRNSTVFQDTHHS